MLIRNADLWRIGAGDLRIAGGLIAEIGQLTSNDGETVLDAGGGALLPGLHDHHIHMAASAARQASIVCGPPEVSSAAELAERLALGGTGWVRGIGYHESVMGLPDASALDRLLATRPLRLQHRSGRMWLLNSLALDELLSRAPAPRGLEREHGRFTGRLFDEDDWLQGALGSTPPEFTTISAELSRYGVTGLTDMSPRNDALMAGHFSNQRRKGALRQGCILAGTLELGENAPDPAWQLGPAKLHLHENAMPGLDDTIAFMRRAHEQGRAIASHCTTETELVFTLAALSAAGHKAGDRIEHAGIATDDLIDQIASTGLAVVSQPHFITERGDQYLRDVPSSDHAALYRLASFQNRGVTLAAGSDAPFGSLDPWQAITAAVSRQTLTGQIIGHDEALSPEEALALFLADPLDLGRQRELTVGAPADLCLLDRAWTRARNELSSDHVRATWIGGGIVHDRIDQSPDQRLPG